MHWCASERTAFSEPGWEDALEDEPGAAVDGGFGGEVEGGVARRGDDEGDFAGAFDLLAGGGLVAHGADDPQVASREFAGEPLGGFGDLAGAVGDDGLVRRAFVLDADAHPRVAPDVVEFHGVSGGAEVELAVSEGVPDRRGQW